MVVKLAVLYKGGSAGSQPYSMTGNIIILYILVFKYREVEYTKVYGLNNNINSLL